MKCVYVVTGGGGFLGRALCQRLLQLGHEVRTICRGTYPDLEAQGVKVYRADLAQHPSNYQQALRGAEAIFHVAAKVDMWGKYSDFLNSNLTATRNLLQASREEKIKKFIFTSSPSVIADGRDLLGIDETYPYPKRYLAYYPQTKALAEREVLSRSGVEFGPFTIALRPHLIWGPGDQNFVPTILERAKAGRLPQIGNGENLVDLSYIEDCVDAHLLAEAALDQNPAARGKVYFISQGEPVKLWEWIAEVLKRNNVAAVKKKIPAALGYGVASILELCSYLRPGRPEPIITRFLASEMATSHYFSIAAAKRDLGYNPKWTIAQALDATFGQLTKKNS